MIKAVYRKGTGFVFWHFCRNCENWPTFDFEEVKDPEHPPKRGLLSAVYSTAEEEVLPRMDRACGLTHAILLPIVDPFLRK
jgi:hypothetical protein